MTEQRLPGRHGSVRRRALRVAFAITLVLATTAGCSDNPEPEPLDRSNVSASPAPSETPEPAGPPTMPPEARGTSKQSAIAFVEHVIDVLNYTARTLDTRPLARLSASDCAACKGILQTTNDIRTARGHISGGSWLPLEVKALSGATKDFIQVQVVVNYAEQSVVESRGTRPKRYPSGRTVYIFDLKRPFSERRLLAIRGGAS